MNDRAETPGPDTPARRPAAGRRVTRRGVAARNALLHAAGAQFAAYGYEAASLDAIVTRAGLSKGSLYFHFPHKAALAEAVIAESAQRRRDAALTAPTDGLDPLHTLIVQVRAINAVTMRDPVVHGGNRLLGEPSLTIHSTNTPPGATGRGYYRIGESVIRTQLDAAAAAGLLRPGVDPAELTWALVTQIIGNRLICERTHTLDLLPARIDQMWRTILPLIATDSWLAAWTRPPHRDA